MQDKSNLLTAGMVSGASLLLVSSAVHAATLGDLQVRSYLGERLSVVAPLALRDGESLDEACFAVSASTGDEADFALNGLRKTYTSKGGVGYLAIESITAVQEPIVRLTVRLICPPGNQQTRSYTALMDLAQDRRTSPGPASPQKTAAGFNPAPPFNSAPPSRTPASRGSVGDEAEGVIEVQPGDTLNLIARRLYPEDREARDNFRTVLRSQYGQPLRNGNRPLPTGMKLEIPRQDAPKPIRPLSSERPAAAKPATPPVQPPVVTEKKSKLPAKPETPAPERPVLSIRPLSPGSASENKGSAQKEAQTKNKLEDELKNKLMAMEQLLLDRISEQISAHRSLQDRMERLESYTRELEKQHKAREQDLAAERAARQAAEEAARQWQMRDWIAVIALGLSTVLVLFMVFGGSRRRATPKRGRDDSTLLEVDFSTDLTRALAESADEPPEESAEPERMAHPAQSAAAPNTPPPSLDKAPPNAESRRHARNARRSHPISVVDLPLEPELPADNKGTANVSSPDVEVMHLTNRIDEAVLLSEHGMVDQAVAILRDEIAHRPQYVNAWLSLLKVFHDNGWKDDFIPLARLFKQQFLSKALWAQVIAMGRDIAPDEALFAEPPPPPPPPEPAPAVVMPVAQPAPPPPVAEVPSPRTNDVELLFTPAEVKTPTVAEPIAWAPPEKTPTAPLAAPSPLAPGLTLDLSPTQEPEAFAESITLSAVDNLQDAGFLDSPLPLENDLEIDFMGPNQVDPALIDRYPRLGQVAELLSLGSEQAAVDLLQQSLIEGDWAEKTEALRLLGHLKLPASPP